LGECFESLWAKELWRGIESLFEICLSVLVVYGSRDG